MMPAPRLEIDLAKISHNARILVERLARRGISVTGVTKATLGSVKIAEALLRAGVDALGESRIENIETLRRGHVSAPIHLIRSPMLSQVERIVAHTNVSFNTEIEVIRRLAHAAQKLGQSHGVVLMVELGDLREGIMPEDLLETVRETLRLPNIDFKGIGTNLACRCGVSPDGTGGNSANLQWALSGVETGRINELRLGEAILLGCETLQRQPIDGLNTDAITLFAEVIESKIKPSQPTGKIAQAAFGQAPELTDRGEVNQMILAIGRQDIDPSGLQPPVGYTVMGASSDHLILESGSDDQPVGAEVPFQLNYSALVRAMTSPFITKNIKEDA
jgi:predicted amino acid racemase